MDAAELESRLKRIRAVLLDVDGVLTDGRIIYDNYGDELKFFDATDGMGIELLGRAGIVVIFVTSKKSKANQRRARELKIRALHQGVRAKGPFFDKTTARLGLRPEEICVMGDDLVDVPMMRRAGLAVAVSNAVRDVKTCAHYVTTKHGGRGAVREVAEMILRAQAKWPAVTEPFLA